MPPFRLFQRKSPLIVSMPHLGYAIPAELSETMTASGRMSLDTDWNLDELYDFLGSRDVSLIQSVYSRYVVDLGRDPSNKPLYTGVDHPTLLPTETFDRVPLYRSGKAPGEAEITRRVDMYWRPYHEALGRLIAEALENFGTAVLFECHSIASVVPRYAPGRIPDLNLGTAGGTSCCPTLSAALMDALTNDAGFTTAHNGLFKGGYITRHYGQPDREVHAFQLELSRATYMGEAPTPWLDDGLAANVRPILARMTDAAIGWAHQRSAEVTQKHAART